MSQIDREHSNIKDPVPYFTLSAGKTLEVCLIPCGPTDLLVFYYITVILLCTLTYDWQTLPYLSFLAPKFEEVMINILSGEATYSCMRHNLRFSYYQVRVSPKNTFGNFHTAAYFWIRKGKLIPFPIARVLASFTHNPQHLNFCASKQGNILRMLTMAL